MSLELMDLGSLDGLVTGIGPAQTGRAELTGLPLQLPLDLVDEDPDQPRREFDPEALQELAQTIQLRGVRQPVSVRPHPQVAGRWMLNFGARRLRASKLAGQGSIPAFVDATADSYDQVIENEQRQSLRPLELAMFIQGRLAAGESKSDIARRLGKSKSVVTCVCALIDAPDWLLEVYRSGKCQGYVELYQLRQCHDADPKGVEAWAAGLEVIDRSEVKRLRERSLVSGRGAASAPAGPLAVASSAVELPAADAAHKPSELRTSVAERVAVPALQTAVPLTTPPAAALLPSAPTTLESGQAQQALPLTTASATQRSLLARWGERVVALVLNSVPEQAGLVWVQASDNGGRQLVPASELKLLGAGEVGAAIT